MDRYVRTRPGDYVPNILITIDIIPQKFIKRFESATVAAEHAEHAERPSECQREGKIVVMFLITFKQTINSGDKWPLLRLN